MSPQLPDCKDCNDNIPHAVAGYCLVADGTPVLVVTTVDCTTGQITIELVDPVTGLSVPTQPIQACASLSLEVLDTEDCDANVIQVDAIPVVHQGVSTVKTCKDKVLNIGNETIVVPDSPATASLTVPVGADFALIENFFTSNRSVRWRGDGTLPLGGGNAGLGHWLTPGTSIEYVANLAALRFTKDQIGGIATLEVSYYQYI